VIRTSIDITSMGRIKMHKANKDKAISNNRFISLYQDRKLRNFNFAGNLICPADQNAGFMHSAKTRSIRPGTCQIPFCHKLCRLGASECILRQSQFYYRGDSLSKEIFRNLNRFKAASNNFFLIELSSAHSEKLRATIIHMPAVIQFT